MPGSIQSIERAAAVLRLLAGSRRPLRSAELAAALDLPRPTLHGILRTLRDVGFVEQEADGAPYRLADALRGLGPRGVDEHDLRSCAMNWADSLAGGTGLATYVGVLDGHAVRLIHHVFRPYGPAQRLAVGEALPLHASALGKCLLAFDAVEAPPIEQLSLDRFTRRTRNGRDELLADLAAARPRGWAGEIGEFCSGTGAAAAPIRGSGGAVVGALGVAGPVEELFTAGDVLRARIVEPLLGAARAVSAAVGEMQSTLPQLSRWTRPA